MFFKNLFSLGDRLEDKTRARLSRVPFVYAALGGAGIVLFWRGVWHTVDYLMSSFVVAYTETGDPSAVGLPWWDGPLSLIAGSVLLLSIGLFVTSFIGDAIIISGLKSGKKLTEKTQKEVLTELKETDQMYAEIHAIHKRMTSVERSMRVFMAERKTGRVRKTKQQVKRKNTRAMSDGA